jgi:hypothetical protein
VGRLTTGQPAEEAEDPVDAEQRQGDDEEAGDRSAAHRDLDRLDEAPPRGRGRSTFALTLMYIPMMPEAIEQAAPTMNASPVRQPRSRPKIFVSATSAVSNTLMTPPMTTAPTMARTPMVVYWRRMKATAPSKIVPATACISTVPVSRDSTSRAR